VKERRGEREKRNGKVRDRDEGRTDWGRKSDNRSQIDHRKRKRETGGKTKGRNREREREKGRKRK